MNHREISVVFFRQIIHITRLIPGITAARMQFENGGLPSGFFLN
ncbi:hypothetical protein [Alkalicoccus saliphilus]|nr:hypothetical protein [Alkalicoccus saliphilus]